MQNIVLITVDCLRHDSTRFLPSTRSHFEIEREVITAGTATNWSFPGLFASQYYPDVYSESGRVKSEIYTLTEMFESAGYRTAGVVSSNPFIAKWSEFFDKFSNDRWEVPADDPYVSDEGLYSNRIKELLSQFSRTARLRSSVPASVAVDRAMDWYSSTAGPKFLWLHLMDPHFPYYPGLKRASSVGLLRSYYAMARYGVPHYRDEIPENVHETYRSLYNECVKAVDTALKEVYDRIDDDDALILTADHGEEFDHGHYGHHRLYDECVRVPLFAKNIEESAALKRQIDVGPTLLKNSNINIPQRWVGTNANNASSTAKIVSQRSNGDRMQFGVRTPKSKIIQTISAIDGNVSVEAYDLIADPKERSPISPENLAEPELKSVVVEFAERMGPKIRDDFVVDASSGTEQRLKNLGYL